MKPAVIILTSVTFAAVVGCVPAPQKMMLYTTLDTKEAAIVNIKGDADIVGNAFMRQNGGAVVTCAGTEVSLIPATSYADERMLTIYGNTDKGYRSIYRPISTVNNVDYNKFQRKTTCDSQGKFHFAEVSFGTYYVVTGVKWLAGGENPQGGALMARIKVAPASKNEVVLSP